VNHLDVGKFGTNPPEMGGKLVRFPARYVETLDGQGCDKGKRAKKLVKILGKWGKYLISFLSNNFVPNEFGPSNSPPPGMHHILT